MILTVDFKDRDSIKYRYGYLLKRWTDTESVNITYCSVYVLVIDLGMGRAHGYSIEIQELRREPRFLNRDRITLRETQNPGQ